MGILRQMTKGRISNEGRNEWTLKAVQRALAQPPEVK
jgi:hypothetical protein